MYSVLFESDNGKKYYFGEAGNTAFDMDLGDGMSVNLGLSQGFGQIGATVETQDVEGRPIAVHGCVYGNIAERKRTMRNVLAPFTSGTLIFENKYYTRVFVKDAPTFSSVKGSGVFSMQFYAPYPFFYSLDRKNIYVGAILPMFSFPVNYAQPHQFGKKAAARYTNIINDGDVKVPYSVTISTSGTSTNVTITNLETFKKLKINGALNAGDEVNIYRDDQNILRAELTADGVTKSIISRVDESSTLFELETGDNYIGATDDEGGASLTVMFEYNPAVVSVYED